MSEPFLIRPARREDSRTLLEFIRELAQYERLTHRVEATESQLEKELFGPHSRVEALLGFLGQSPAAFAVYFHNFSTFLGRRGLYLEDLFVRPEFRRRGFGRAMLLHVGRIARERGCGRFEWAVLDWNRPAIKFYESMGAVLLHDWRICRVTGAALERMADMNKENP